MLKSAGKAGAKTVVVAGKVGRRIPIVGMVGETIYNTGDNMRRHFGLQIWQSVKLGIVGIMGMIADIILTIKRGETHPGVYNEYLAGRVKLKTLKELGQKNIFKHFISSVVLLLIVMLMVIDVVMSSSLRLVLYYSIALIMVFPFVVMYWTNYMAIITGLGSSPLNYLVCMVRARQYRYLFPSEKILSKSLREFQEAKKKANSQKTQKEKPNKIIDKDNP
jgi:hypothetical protein